MSEIEIEDRDRSGSLDDWTSVDLSAFGLLNLSTDEENITDDVVNAAYAAALKVPMFARDTDKLKSIREAFDTLATASRREGYKAALHTMKEWNSLEGSLSGAFNDPNEQHGGISQMLCASDAPYGRLIAAALRVRGSFELELPEIIVCGEENQGKSSTLERIAMRDIFPRDKMFCTRMPIRLMLRCHLHQNQVQLRVKDAESGEIVREMEPQICTTGDQNSEPFSSQVAELVREFILAEHPDDDGTNVIADREIQVEIRAPNVPTIDLIDLPGVVAAPEEARQRTVELTRKMLSKTHALVIAVISARNESLRNSSIWGLLKESGKPAVIVLSKVDVAGGSLDLKERLELSPMVMPRDADIHAVIPVVNRITSVDDNLDKLRLSFQNEDAVLRDILETEGVEFDPTKHGMRGVLVGLNGMIQKYMREKWVYAERERCKDELQRLFTEVWKLGTDPTILRKADIASALSARCDDLLEFSLNEWLCICFAQWNRVMPEVPGFATFLRRVQLSRDLIARVESDIVPTLVSTVWSSIKTLVLNEVLDEDLPIKLRRFPAIASRISTLLDKSFEQRLATSSANLAALLKVRFQIILEGDSDKIDNEGMWTMAKQAAISEVIYQMWGNASIIEEFCNEMDGMKDEDFYLLLVEDAQVQARRKQLLESINLTYRAVEALRDLELRYEESGADHSEDSESDSQYKDSSSQAYSSEAEWVNFFAARTLEHGGPTSALVTLIDDEDFDWSLAPAQLNSLMCLVKKLGCHPSSLTRHDIRCTNSSLIYEAVEWKLADCYLRATDKVRMDPFLIAFVEETDSAVFDKLPLTQQRRVNEIKRKMMMNPVEGQNDTIPSEVPVPQEAPEAAPPQDAAVRRLEEQLQKQNKIIAELQAKSLNAVKQDAALATLCAKVKFLEEQKAPFPNSSPASLLIERSDQTDADVVSRLKAIERKMTNLKGLNARVENVEKQGKTITQIQATTTSLIEKKMEKAGTDLQKKIEVHCNSLAQDQKTLSMRIEKQTNDLFALQVDVASLRGGVELANDYLRQIDKLKDEIRSVKEKLPPSSKLTGTSLFQKAKNSSSLF